MPKPTKTTSKKPPFFLKFTLIIAKIAEVIHWVLVGVMAFTAFASVINPTSTDGFLTSLMPGESTVSCYGFSAAISHETSTGLTPSPAAITFFCFGSAIVLSLMAMIFRNVYLILKTAQGQTWFANGSTPFQANIVRMIREIGIFFLSISALSLLSAIIVSLSSAPAVGFNYENAFIGLVFLCFSAFFSYGAKLQEDVDGLI